MDESYYTVLEKGGKSSTEKASRKVYIWAALASHLRLVHFFYENGSRARKVLTQYIKPDYRGAIQTDGLGDYKILETDEYPCVWHAFSIVNESSLTLKKTRMPEKS